mmetsp:Transcript_25654/g.81041  ORF Transcript_25654/g.81041 Transcript_25654/m.81041 type:complete len:292 (+) Transcript_25654:319-1194(+)|eukprot:scaffold7551_cov123-Isochrysis_galbana.AAC.4
MLHLKFFSARTRDPSPTINMLLGLLGADLRCVGSTAIVGAASPAPDPQARSSLPNAAGGAHANLCGDLRRVTSLDVAPTSSNKYNLPTTLRKQKPGWWVGTPDPSLRRGPERRLILVGRIAARGPSILSWHRLASHAQTVVRLGESDGRVRNEETCTLWRNANTAHSPHAESVHPPAPPEPRSSRAASCTQPRRKLWFGKLPQLAAALTGPSAARRSPRRGRPGRPSGNCARCWRRTPTSPSSPGARRAPGTRRRAAGERPCSARDTCGGTGGVPSVGGVPRGTSPATWAS